MTVANPVYGPRNPVTCIAGHPGETSCPIVVFTLSDPAIAPVVLNVNGQSITPVLTARGSPTVCWTGLVTVGDLVPDSRYSWTVTQGSERDAGGFVTKTTKKKHALLAVGCDKVHKDVVTVGFFNGSHLAGSWDQIRAMVESADYHYSGLIFNDDFGYVDKMSVDDSANSGLTTGEPEDTGTLNSYLVAWCCYLGMLGPETTSPATWGSNNDATIAQPREANRAWCRKNLNWYVQWGDHEFRNNVSWMPDGSDGSAMDATVRASGKAAWEATLGLLQPPLDGVAAKRDSAAKHWAISLPGVTILCPDPITNLPTPMVDPVNGIQARHSPSGSLSAPQTATFLGENQIFDMLEAADTLDNKFTLLSLGYVGLRYPLPRSGSTPPEPASYSGSAAVGAVVIDAGEQQALYDHCLAEFQKFITRAGQTPKSFMDNVKTNGRSGHLVVLHGDIHRRILARFKHAAYVHDTSVNELAENFYALHHGAMTSGQAGVPANINGAGIGSAPTVTVADMDIEYCEADVSPPYSSFARLVVDIEIVGREQLLIEGYDIAGNKVINRKLLSLCHNALVNGDYAIPGVNFSAPKSEAL